MQRAIAVLSALACLAVLLSACGGSRPSVEPAQVTVEVPVVETVIVRETREIERTVVVTATPEPTPAYASKLKTEPGVLVFPLVAEPRSLDPQHTGDEQSDTVVQQLYEGLFSLQADGSIKPAAAVDYAVSGDGKTVTVTLRSGLTWSDGAPVTAEHYVDGVCRLLDPRMGNAYYYLLSEVAGISGAHDYAVGETVDCARVGVAALDVSTLVLSLNAPVAYLPQILATKHFLPVRSDLLEAESLAGALVGNGPYLLADWQPGQRLVLAKNSHYWDSANVTIDRIELPIIPRVGEQFERFLQGELAVAAFPAQETARIVADPILSGELQVLVQPGISYLGLNTQYGPTASVEVRRAIASAIDREALVNMVLRQPWHVTANTVIPPGIPGYQGQDPTMGYPYNPDAARQFLSQAGYAPDNPPPAIDLWFNHEGNNPILFAAISEMLESVGIPVRSVSSSWDVFLNSLNACNKPNVASARQGPGECTYGVYRMGWVLDYADASSILGTVFSPRSAFQYTGWVSGQFDELLASASLEQGEQQRLDLYRQAERLLVNEEVAVIPLMYYDRTLLVKAGLTFEFPPFGAPSFRDWRLPGS